jgi:hypothetical protein
MMMPRMTTKRAVVVVALAVYLLTVAQRIINNYNNSLTRNSVASTEKERLVSAKFYSHMPSGTVVLKEKKENETLLASASGEVILYNSSQPYGGGAATGMLKEKKENKTLSGLTSVKVLYNSSKLSGTGMLEKKKENRLSSMEAKHLLENNTLEISRVPYLLPKPKRQDITSIYNRDAWIALRRVLTTREQFSLCANGGSSTAGGGGAGGAQFYFKFVNFMKVTGVTLPDAKVHIIQRGHGARGSLHSGMVSASYFPPNIDILIWEFAINDEGVGRLKDKTPKFLEMKNALIYWLEQVSIIKPRPPLVILA